MALESEITALREDVRNLNATVAQLIQVIAALASRGAASLQSEAPASNVTPIAAATTRRGPGRPKKEPEAVATTPATQLAEMAQDAQPAEEPKPALTYETVKNALVELSRVKSDAPFTLLEKHKLTRLPDLKPEKYQEFMEDIEKAHKG